MASFEVPIQRDFSAEPLEDSGGAHLFDSSPVAYLHPGYRVESWSYEYAKRALDLLLGVVMLVLAVIPGVLIALAVAVTSRGPIFYREDRVGRGGRLFRIWKFRSMCSERRTESKRIGHDGEQELLWRIHKSGGNARITSVGRLLRRWSLDELPQLINVLRGEMSLVGPRPVIAAEIPLYGSMQDCYLAAKPGVSGLWQVSGRSNTGFPQRARLDASYVQNWSLLADLKILTKTIPAVLGRVGAR